MTFFEEWLAEADRLQQTSHRRDMTAHTPTGQLRIALKIIKAVMEGMDNEETGSGQGCVTELTFYKIAEAIINGESKT